MANTELIPSALTGTQVGILGGGQLARMLAEAALRLGLTPIVYAENAAEPASQLSPQAVFGKLDDENALRRFFLHLRRTSAQPIVAFENEFVDVAKLAKAAQGLGVAFHPSLAAIEKLQDKLSQKESLRSLGVATAPWVELKGQDVEGWLEESSKELGGQSVLKWAKYGYDGKGTHFDKGDRAAALEFCRKARSRVFAEKAIRFKRELAVVAVRSVTGEFAAYPLVVTEQPEGTCLRVTGPASSLGVPHELEAKAWAHAKRFSEANAITGAFAIEFFEAESGDLLVNEIAPRVHNSGHYTQNASSTSQFENHWRALLGLELGSTSTAPAFAMMNLLGPKGVSLEAKKAGLPRPGRFVSAHWYGKSEIRPGRKLGHLNACAQSIDGLPALLKAFDEIHERWVKDIAAAAAAAPAKKGGTGT